MGQSKFAVATFGYFGSLKLLSQAASTREFSLVAVFDAAALLLPLQVLPAWGFVLSFVVGVDREKGELRSELYSFRVVFCCVKWVLLLLLLLFLLLWCCGLCRGFLLLSSLLLLLMLQLLLFLWRLPVVPEEDDL